MCLKLGWSKSHPQSMTPTTTPAPVAPTDGRRRSSSTIFRDGQSLSNRRACRLRAERPGCLEAQNVLIPAHSNDRPLEEPARRDVAEPGDEAYAGNTDRWSRQPDNRLDLVASVQVVAGQQLPQPRVHRTLDSCRYVTLDLDDTFDVCSLDGCHQLNRLPLRGRISSDDAVFVDRRHACRGRRPNDLRRRENVPGGAASDHLELPFRTGGDAYDSGRNFEVCDPVAVLLLSLGDRQTHDGANCPHTPLSDASAWTPWPRRAGGAGETTGVPEGDRS